MKMHNIFFAKYAPEGKQYIFELPSFDATVNTGDRLVVCCKDGESVAFAASKNFLVPREVARAIAAAMGGYWPLAHAKTKVCRLYKTVVEDVEVPFA